MSNNKQSSVEWLVEQIKKDINLRLRGFDIDKAFEQAKVMERNQHGKTWDDAMENIKARGGNDIRAWADFDDYYNETYGGNNE